MQVKTVNIEDKFRLIKEYWNPKIVAKLNKQQVKLAKLKGEFTWHSHQNEDELFLVLEGNLSIELDQETLSLTNGEMVVIPRGVRHRPVAHDEVKVLLFEPETTLNTGDVNNAFTQSDLEEI